MNRVPFDQLVRAVHPASELAGFGGSEHKLKRIEKLEKDMALMANELSLYKAQVQEMAGHLGNDGLAIQNLNVSMASKASSKDLLQAKTESVGRDAGLKHDFAAYMEKFKQPIGQLMHDVRGLKEKQTVMFTANAHHFDSIAWLKDAVRALRDNTSFPPYPHEYKQSLPDGKTRWPTGNGERLYDLPIPDESATNQ